MVLDKLSTKHAKYLEKNTIIVIILHNGTRNLDSILNISKYFSKPNLRNLQNINKIRHQC